MKWHQWSSCNWSNCKKPLHCIEIVYLQLQKEKLLCVVFLTAVLVAKSIFLRHGENGNISPLVQSLIETRLKSWKKKTWTPADVKTKTPLSEKCLYHCPMDSCTVEFKVKILKLIHRFTITFPFCKLHGFY